MHGRRTCLALALAGLLLAAACGQEEKRHGLRKGELASKPGGEAITVHFGAADGEAFVAVIRMETSYAHREPNGAPEDSHSGSGTVQIEIKQVFARPDPAAPLRSAVELRFTKAEGERAKKYLERKPVFGGIAHGPDGRPLRGTRELTTGTPGEQVEAHTILESLVLAGAGGSPSWLPPRPVRVGEAWQLESFMEPPALENVLRQARRVGMTIPEPVFSGTARLEKVTEGEDGPLLEVTLDSLLEVEGPSELEGQKGYTSIGDRVRGRAVISAKTGLPVTFRCVHTGSRNQRLGRTRVERDFTSKVEGRVERLGGR
jgi:hypothetical protein